MVSTLFPFLIQNVFSQRDALIDMAVSILAISALQMHLPRPCQLLGETIKNNLPEYLQFPSGLPVPVVLIISCTLILHTLTFSLMPILAVKLYQVPWLGLITPSERGFLYLPLCSTCGKTLYPLTLSTTYKNTDLLDLRVLAGIQGPL